MITMHEFPIWIQGTLVSLFGSTLTALGLVLQKQSHGERLDGDTSSEEASKFYWTQPRWLLGFLIFLAAQLINMVAMAMAPQAILSCLGSWTLVCNTFFARTLLKETVTHHQVVAVCGLMVSAAAVIYSAPRPSDSKESTFATVTFLAKRFVSPEFQVLTLVLFSFVCFTGLVATGRVRCCGTDAATSEPVDASTPSPVSPSRRMPMVPVSPTAAEVARRVAEAARKARDVARKSAVPFCFAASAAVAAGYTALLFKCVAELLAGSGAAVAGGLASSRDEHPWMCWESYLILASALSCAPAELHFLNLALQEGEASFVVPTYLSLGMIAQLSTGVVFFEEYLDFASPQHAVEFGCSVLMTLISVVLMAKAQALKAREEEEAAMSDFQRPLLSVAEEGSFEGTDGESQEDDVPQLQSPPKKEKRPKKTGTPERVVPIRVVRAETWDGPDALDRLLHIPPRAETCCFDDGDLRRLHTPTQRRKDAEQRKRYSLRGRTVSVAGFGAVYAISGLETPARGRHLTRDVADDRAESAPSSFPATVSP